MSAVDVLADKCFACGKKLGKRGGYLVDTRDDQEVFVGPECLKHVQAAGKEGYQPPKGGPRLWPLSVAGVLADMDRCTRELPGTESEILCQARAAVAELIAERDRLTNIVRDHEAQILRMTEERATLKEEWFMCCHPAWPDPLRCWGGREDAIATIKAHPHPEAWLLRTLAGGRIEYKGKKLAALSRVDGAA